MTIIKNRLIPILGNEWPGVLVVLVAIGLRLYHLAANPLWLDEIFTVQLSRQSLGVILQDSFKEPNPPLYHLLTTLTAGLWNVQSEWGWRWQSALAGILTIAGFYLLCRRFTSRMAASLASLAFAVSPFHVYYSQEARSFAVGTLLAVWSTILVADLIKSPRQLRGWIVLAILSILGIYTSYFYLLIVGIQGLILLFASHKRGWWSYVLITAVCCVPAFWMFLSAIPTTVGKRSSLISLNPLTIIQSLGGEPARFGVHWQHWLLVAAVSVIVVPGIYYALRKPDTRLAGLYFGLQLVIPMLTLLAVDLGLGISLPLFETRQFLILLPALFLIFALGLDFLFTNLGIGIPIIIVALIMVASTVGLQADWSLTKSPETVLLLTIRPEVETSDTVVSLDYYTAAASYFYLSSHPVINYLKQNNGEFQFTNNLLLFPIIPSDQIPVSASKVQDIRNSPRFWVLSREGINTDVFDTITAHCTLEKTVTVTRFSATLWGSCLP